MVRSEAFDMYRSSDLGGARSAFEELLDDGKGTIDLESQYYEAISALKLYHLDGEKRMDDFLDGHPHAPEAGLAHFELGLFFFQDRDYKRTIEHLNKLNLSLLNKQQKMETNYKLAYSLFARKKLDIALPKFNAIKNSNSKYSGFSHYLAGYIEFQQGDYDEALKDYKKLENDPIFGKEVPYMIAGIYYKQENYKKLVDYVRPVLDQNNKVNRASLLSLLLAESYYGLGQFEEAVHYYSIAYEKQQFTPEAIFHFGNALKKGERYAEAAELLKSIASPKSATGTYASYALGEVYLELGNKAFALSAFNTVAKSDQADLKKEALFISGKLAFELDRTSESIADLKSYSEKYPNGVHLNEVASLLSQAYVSTSNYALAIRYIEGLPQREPEVRNAYQKATYLYGVEQYNKRNFRQAVALLQKSLESPENKIYEAKSHFWLGESYSIGRRYEEAKPHYQHVLTLIRDKETLSLKARYGLAYCEYNLRDYQHAVINFKKFLLGTKESNSKYGDAQVRLADCYYVTKNYNMALQTYEKAINAIVRQKDYAYYQSGVIYGIMGNSKKALGHLQRVIAIYQKSPYVDDALFEIGSIQLEGSHFSQAVKSFNKLITSHPRSRYVPYALERRAVANFNLKNYASTIRDYQQFLQEYPSHTDVKNVLLGLQEAFSQTNEPDKFSLVLNEFKKKNPHISGLQAVEYETVKGYYNDQDYTKSAYGFKTFITENPEDPNVFEAKFLLAESLYRLGRNDSALLIYSQVFFEKQCPQLNRVAERIADIDLAKSRYAESLPYFNEVKNNAVNNNQTARAWLGLARSHYFLAHYDSSEWYANQLIDSGDSTSSYSVQGRLFLARTYYAKGMYNDALLQFETISNLVQDEPGAEAQYYIGEVLHQQGDFKSSNEALYQIPKKFGSYTTWLDKAFLLVANNFIGMKEYFQATATLQSMIDNSETPATVEKAAARLEEVKQMEEKQGKKINDTLSIGENDSIK